MSTLKQLIECEISDFFAGFGHPGEPETPEEMQSQLLARVMPLFAGLEQEPIILYRERNPYNGMSTGWIELTPDEYDFVKDNASDNADFKTVYAAPQLPQPAVVSEKAITQHFDTIALDTAKMIMCDVNRRNEFCGGDIQLLSRIQCRIDEACRAAMLQGKAEPVSQAHTLPEGYCAMPKRLTAENGAKGALSGEFHVTHRITCQSCGGEGCEDCNEEGGWDGEIPIGWDAIKLIYGAAVESCALPAAPQQEADNG